MSPPRPHFGNRTQMNADAFDYAATMNRLGGDEELFTDLVKFFREDIEGLLVRLREGLERREAGTVERAAHSIKGLCANFGARRAVEAAAAVEEAASEGRLTPRDIDPATLEAAVQELKDALTRRFGTTQAN